MGRKRDYRPGSFYRADDRTGFVQRAERTGKEWNGSIVDKSVWEPRQPQDLVQGVRDDQSVGIARPISRPTFVGPFAEALSQSGHALDQLLYLDDTTGMNIGDTARVVLDSGALFQARIDGVGTDAILIEPPIPSGVAAGNLVYDIGPSTMATVQQLFDSQALAKAAFIASPIQVIYCAGYAVAGDGGYAVCVRIAGPGTYPGSWFQSADGSYWLIQRGENGVNCLAFGAVGDGAVNSSTRVFSGTDNWQAIQNACDYAFYSYRCQAYLPAGIYRITNTIQLTYGVGFRSGHLVGAGKRYVASSFVGTLILCDFADRPGVAVNAARLSSIRHLSLMGTNFHWLEGTAVGGAKPTTDDTQLINWIDPALLLANPNINAQFTPYCAIAIDPYAGTQPATHYPNVTFPSWSGISTQYGKGFSSGVIIEDVWIGGFVAALAIQPCNADGNGDFIKLIEVATDNNTYVITAGNTQGRVCTTESCQMAGFHSGIVNGVHGKQKGKLDLHSVGTDWENCIQIIDITDSALAGSFLFEGGYSESIWRIGNWLGGSSSNKNLIFNTWDFHFSLQNDWRGHPRTTISGRPSNIMFEGCAFAGFPSVLGAGTGIAALGLCFESCQINSSTTETLTYRQLATNFLGGGWVLNPIQYNKRPERYSMKPSAGYNIDTGANDVVYWKGFSNSDRQHPICAWHDRVRPSAQPAFVLEAPSVWDDLSKLDPSITAKSFTGSTLSLTINPASRTAATLAKKGPLPGDVVWDDQTGICFFVRSYTPGTGVMLAEIQNGYLIVGGTFDAAGNTTGGGTVTIENGVTLSLTSGTWYFGNSRVFTPSRYCEGDISLASPVIDNAGRPDGFATWMTTQILVGDYLYIDDLTDPYFSTAATLVAAVAGSGGTNRGGKITLSGNGQIAYTRHELKFFCRQPPANV